MSTRKSMTLPVIITLILIVIIIYLFATLKQSQVVCEKVRVFDANIRLEERIVSTLDGKSIKGISVTKIITLPDKYAKEKYFNSIKFSLEKTLSYLDDKVKYTIDGNKLFVRIDVNKDEIVLLDNINFIDNGTLEIKVESNTKSNDVVTLSVGDNYTDGELMKKLKNKGYICK